MAKKYRLEEQRFGRLFVLYEKGRKEQAYNRQNTRYVTYNNETHTLIEWAEKLHISYSTICCRYKKGWSDKEIIEGRKRKV